MRVYRAPAAKARMVLLPGWAFMVTAFIAMAVEGGDALLIGLAAMSPFVVLLGLLQLLVERSATLVDDGGVALRGPFRTIRYPWSQIADLTVESVVGAVSETGVPRPGPGGRPDLVALYDRTGRRRYLPGFSSATVPGFHQEAAALRAEWERRRGADWTPPPGAVPHPAATRVRMSPWVVGLGPAMMWTLPSIPVGAIVLLVPLLALGVWEYPGPQGIMAVLLSPAMITLGPAAVVFCVSYGTAVARARRENELSR
ncbi:PH domain-containing protein [Allonocardiopsis opalescens]|uniref:PH (Pleckstrin Homology) domain-containing protein n=1 Tax=Allonocardiopsis opalescens TaxID=1144618 RepID=A0A2T0Q5M6_9ACTN|nr:PH domain-containing protein [Allonocardiopsis opalescens]PRX99083.1 PH (Pleckstrin Homology) domain-containing protein [Allonocardiopsis opalescens]